MGTVQDMCFSLEFGKRAHCSCMQMREEFEAQQAALKADLAGVRAELATQAKACDQHAASNKILKADITGLQTKLAAAQARVAALAGGAAEYDLLDVADSASVCWW